MKYWELIAHRLSASGLSWGCSSQSDAIGHMLLYSNRPAEPPFERLPDTKIKEVLRIKPDSQIADSSSRNAVSISSDRATNLFPSWRCTRTSPSILSTQVGCRLARRLRRRTKVQYAAVRSDGKIAFDYVIGRLNAVSAGSEKPVGRLNLR